MPADATMSQNAPDIQTLGALRASGYIPRSISAEIRANLIDRLQSGAPLFEGIVGYDDHLATRNAANTRDDATSRHRSVVNVVTG